MAVVNTNRDTLTLQEKTGSDGVAKVRPHIPVAAAFEAQRLRVSPYLLLLQEWHLHPHGTHPRAISSKGLHHQLQLG
jgi:hypothetical protein